MGFSSQKYWSGVPLPSPLETEHSAILLIFLFNATFLISDSLEFMMIIFSWQQRKILLKEAHVGEGMEWASNGGTFH